MGAQHLYRFEPTQPIILIFNILVPKVVVSQVMILSLFVHLSPGKYVPVDTGIYLN